MTNLIHAYLNQHYQIGKDFIRPNSIINDLSLVFALSKKQLKYYIKGWVRKHNRGIDFNKCWKDIDIIRAITSGEKISAMLNQVRAEEAAGIQGINLAAELTEMLLEDYRNGMIRANAEIRPDNNIPINLL